MGGGGGGVKCGRKNKNSRFLFFSKLYSFCVCVLETGTGAMREVTKKWSRSRWPNWDRGQWEMWRRKRGWTTKWTAWTTTPSMNRLTSRNSQDIANHQHSARSKQQQSQKQQLKRHQQNQRNCITQETDNTRTHPSSLIRVSRFLRRPFKCLSVQIILGKMNSKKN